MIKKAKFSYGGINQDISKYKHPGQFYYSANNIRIVATDSQSGESATNHRGNSFILQVPSIEIDTTNKIIKLTHNSNNKTATQTNNYINYTNSEIDDLASISTTSNAQVIIGHAITRDSIILLSTDNNGFDCIWEVEELLSGTFIIQLLYLRNLNFSTNSPIQVHFNYENDIIQKIYWVDGVNQIRFINIKHSIANGDLEELIDINSNTINFVGNFNLTQPQVESITGSGVHTSGMIQYAYNLYRLNASQTTISPLSELISLDNGTGLGGGDVNESVSTTPVVTVNDIDLEYTHIKLYAIKYSSYNQSPQISLIADREIGESDTITYFDDGSIIENLTLEEFLFLGSNPIIPRHIESKDNRLFPASITELNFDVDLDCRAYSFRQNQTSTYILDNVNPIVGTLSIPDAIPTVGGSFLQVDNTYNVPKKHDAANPNYDSYKYQYNSSIQGGEGKYIKYKVGFQSLGSTEDYRFFKSNEIYRIGIQFYNRLGQLSFPKWIADFKAPVGNLTTYFNTLVVELKPEFYVWLNDSSNFETDNDKPIGYKIIRADRTLNDRSILYQGFLTSMMFQVKGDEAQDYEQFETGGQVNFQDDELKIPSWITRTFEHRMSLAPELIGEEPLDPTHFVTQINHLQWLTGNEIHDETTRTGKLSQTFQYDRMMQLYSPEILFNFSQSKAGLVLKVNGLARVKEEYVESQETQIQTNLEKFGGKFRFYPDRAFITNNNMDATFNTPDGGNRFIGPSGDEGTTDFYQYYTSFGNFLYGVNSNEYPIYGIPEISQRGQGIQNYNGDAKYSYANSLQSFISDGEDDCDECDPITSINTWGAKCLTLILGDATTLTQDRTGLRKLYNDTSGLAENGILSVDIKIPNINIYLGNIYGGSTYESKKNSKYIEIGQYKDININNINILSPGDTYVGNFKILRLGKTDTQVLDTGVPQLSEIISFPVETTVDLKNRNDLSLFEWDNRFQPNNDDYHKYNSVYSQQPNLVLNASEGFKFKKLEVFDTRILSSKLKIPGESIDSWTDLLINEVQDLDGKYGPINALVNFRDEIYALQDEGVAMLAINPRVQIQGSDGVSVELGKGNVLYDYNYITTRSGTVNKWSVISTPIGFYYFDLINKSWIGSNGTSPIGLQDKFGMHTWFQNNIIYEDIKLDNPILGKGAIGGYDLINNEVFLTIKQTDNNWSLGFDERYNRFTSFYDRHPSRYINKGFRLITTDPLNTSIYQEYAGKFNNFYNKHYPSTITLLVNPEADLDCVFNNIEYKSEIYLDDLEQPHKTITDIRAYNEYQDSSYIPIVLNKNARRKFRTWRLNIPRNINSRDRIRNPWIYLILRFDNENNHRMILHDIIISYTI